MCAQSRPDEWSIDMLTLFRSHIGTMHVRHGLPCEDNACAYQNQDGTIHLLAVADGHGDPSCMRSNRGSRIAVETARDVLEQFLINPTTGTLSEAGGMDVVTPSLHDLFLLPGRSRMAKRQLTNAIVSQWSERVREDYEAEPLTEGELAMGGRYEQAYRAGEKIEHAYGSTLLAALITPEILVMVQQGDGECFLVEPDGNISYPMPGDDHCMGNVTTSLCDENVANEFRCEIRDLSRNPILGCALASDGVVNSFRTTTACEDELLHLCDALAQVDPAGRDELASSWIENIATNGSGDDVSLALSIDLAGFARVSDKVMAGIQARTDERQLEALDAKLNSMQHKLNVLHGRAIDASRQHAFASANGSSPDVIQSLLDAYSVAEEAYEKYAQRIEEIWVERDALFRKVHPNAAPSATGSVPDFLRQEDDLWSQDGWL